MEVKPTDYELALHYRSVVLNAAAMCTTYTWSSDFAQAELKLAFDLGHIGKHGLRCIQLSELKRHQAKKLGFFRWSDDSEMLLIPLWMLSFLLPGTPVICIDGESTFIGSENFDTDVRGGVLAYGYVFKD